MHRLLPAALICGVLSLAVLSAAEARPIKNRKVTHIDGSKSMLLAKGTRVTVLLFFTPSHRYTAHAFSELARCRKYFGKRPVNFLGVVRTGATRAEVKQALAKIKVNFPVLIDADGALMAQLAIKAYPTFALLDNKKKQLAIKQPITKVGLCERLIAKVKYVLGEISKDKMEAAVIANGKHHAPPGQLKAQRYARFAEMLLKQKNYGPARQTIDKSLKLDPKAARAHAVLGSILLAQKKCKAAAKAFAAALALDKAEPMALAGQKKPCAK